MPKVDTVNIAEWSMLQSRLDGLMARREDVFNALTHGGGLGARTLKLHPGGGQAGFVIANEPDADLVLGAIHQALNHRIDEMQSDIARLEDDS